MKMWYTYIILHYSAVKKNEIMSFAGKWMEIEMLILSEMTRSKKINITGFLSSEAPSSKCPDVNTHPGYLQKPQK